MINIKFYSIILLSFFYFNTAYSGLEGMGNIKLDIEVVKYFKKYLGTKEQNTGEGALKHGQGDYFFVSESGKGFGYSYCPQAYGADGCVKNPLLGKKNCLKDVKEYLKTNEKCFLFAKQRIIVWNGNKIRIPRKATSEEIDEVLKYNNFLD